MKEDNLTDQSVVLLLVLVSLWERNTTDGVCLEVSSIKALLLFYSLHCVNHHSILLNLKGDRPLSVVGCVTEFPLCLHSFFKWAGMI